LRSARTLKPIPVSVADYNESPENRIRKTPRNFSDTEKAELGRRGAPAATQAVSTRSFPRVGWLLIFELVQNFHNTPRRRRRRRRRRRTRGYAEGTSAGSAGGKEESERDEGRDGRDAKRGWRRRSRHRPRTVSNLAKFSRLKRDTRSSLYPFPIRGTPPWLTLTALTLSSLACLSLHPRLLHPRFASPFSAASLAAVRLTLDYLTLSLCPNAHTFSLASAAAEISVQRQRRRRRERSLFLDDVVPRRVTSR